MRLEKRELSPNPGDSEGSRCDGRGPKIVRIVETESERNIRWQGWGEEGWTERRDIWSERVSVKISV